MNLNVETRKAIADVLVANPGAVLERIAKQQEVTTADVVACLPAGEAITIDGHRFTEIMLEITAWGEVMFIVNTEDLVLEAKGVVPEGAMGHGYYNLHGKPIGGHLKADNCVSISFVSRKLFSNDTHSVQFYNRDGGCMFKIYLGRDENRQLIPEQVVKFKTLRDRMASDE